MLGKIEDKGEESGRGWDGWMASPTRWTWIWANSRRRWRTGRPGVLRSMGSQRVRHNWTTEQRQQLGFKIQVSELLLRFPWCSPAKAVNEDEVGSVILRERTTGWKQPGECVINTGSQASAHTPWVRSLEIGRGPCILTRSPSNCAGWSLVSIGWEWVVLGKEMGRKSQICHAICWCNLSLFHSHYSCVCIHSHRPPFSCTNCFNMSGSCPLCPEPGRNKMFIEV